MTKSPPLKNTKVFQPIKVSINTISNRVVFVPTTRRRNLEDNTPSQLTAQHYDERSKYPGSLVITEATFVSGRAGALSTAPAIETKKQTEAWKKVVQRIHDNGSFASSQLWFLGRVSYEPEVLKQKGFDLVGPSAIYSSAANEKNAIAAGNPLRSLSETEIKDIIYTDYTNAAKNAIEAGYDYIELHGAHGYLLDQFLQPVSNARTDKYGGSIENRARFVLELIDHLIPIVGASKLAIRLSPWAKAQGMIAEKDSVHPITTFSYLLNELQKRADTGNQLAYISIVEPRVSGGLDVADDQIVGNNDFITQIWKGIVIRAGNYSYDAPEFRSIQEDVENDRTLVGFSRYFTSNPDLVNRLAEGFELTPYNRPTFYSESNWGYNTYNEYGDSKSYLEDEEGKNLPKEISESINTK
ncbi:NADH:flavin oxidoreductase/NADH oxidase [Scheffersomyces coipomensis]|uniref:NADH:flavin oxidoreductase/NADH oxidase n=1 Tax=Scheffersomyces coipomensis TaxID=1788519 RepID=UPI00315C662E